MNYRDFIEFGVLKINTCLQGNTQSLVAATTLTASSPNVNFLNHTTGFITTLPAPVAGLNYKFIVKTIPTSGNCTIYAAGGADIIVGVLAAATADDLGASDANADTISFVASTCIIGDNVTIECNSFEADSWLFMWHGVEVGRGGCR